MLSPDGAPPIDDAALFSSSLHPPPESAAVGPSCHRQVLVAGRERSLRDGEQAGGNPFSVCVCLCVCSAALSAALSADLSGLYAVLLPCCCGLYLLLPCLPGNTPRCTSPSGSSHDPSAGGS